MIKSLIKPLEIWAGTPFPRSEDVRREATLDGDFSESELYLSVRHERSKWRRELYGCRGARLILADVIEAGREIFDELTDRNNNDPNYEGEQ